MKPFSDVKDDLEPDGALCDFYIQNISSAEWDRFLAVVPALAERSVFTWGDKECSLPRYFNEIQQMQESTSVDLTIWVAGQAVCCHFFVDSEIELDFQPEDFQTEQRWQTLVEFFQSLVDAIGKRGIITPENYTDYVIDEVIPK